MQKLIIGLASAIVMTAAPVMLSPLSAQGMAAQKRQNVTYHSVEFIRFKQGKRERAGEIVEKYFAPASRASKTPEPVEYHLDSGEWDYVLIWPLKAGLADLEWETAPDDVAWMKSLSTIAGGDQQAQALITEWDSLVDRRVKAIAHHHNPK